MGFGILSSVRMRVLFAISIVAFVALLWATVAIVQHIRGARRRHRLNRLAESATDIPNRP
jgi:hypothetical protein